MAGAFGHCCWEQGTVCAAGGGLGWGPPKWSRADYHCDSPRICHFPPLLKVVMEVKKF